MCRLSPAINNNKRRRATHQWILFMTGIDEYAETTEQNLIIRISKSEAEVTNNKRLRSRSIVHKCLHACSSSTIPVRTVYTSLHQRWTSFPAFSNIWRSARAKDVNVNIRSFAVSGPSVWNKLPATLRVSPTLGQFQSKLKAVLFRSAYKTWLGAFVTA